MTSQRIDTFSSPRWFIHVLWIGTSWDGGRIGEVRAFRQPVMPLCPKMQWPERQAVQWAANVTEGERNGEPSLLIGMHHAFTEKMRTGEWRPMPLEQQLELVGDLLGAASMLGFPGVHWLDCQDVPGIGGRSRTARLKTRLINDLRDARTPMAQGDRATPKHTEPHSRKTNPNG